MISQPIAYKISGSNDQLLEVILSPGETIIAEAGAMVYMDDGISYETCLGDGSEPNPNVLSKIFPPATKAVGGDTLFLTCFTNYGRGDRKIMFSNPFSGSVYRLGLVSFGMCAIVQRSSFLCGPRGLKTSCFAYKNTTLPSRKESFRFQRVWGVDEFYLNVSGTLVERKLENETLHLDLNSILAFDASLDLTVEPVGRIKTMILGNDAYVMAALKGTGRVWVQSNSMLRLMHILINNMQHVKISGNSLLWKYYED